VPDGDVLVHAGDATMLGKPFEVSKFSVWFNTLPHKHKIFVPGNHDFMFQQKPRDAAELFLGYDAPYPFDSINREGRVTHLLVDSACTIDGVRFYGSPWTPAYMDWAFQLPPYGPEMKAKRRAIPECDVLVTHGPPQTIFDDIPGVGCVGCAPLMERVLEIRPKLHVFGHIHCGHGEGTCGYTHFVNAAICDEGYRPTHSPIVVDL
jgi:Icc-related predicted phosphoesterase